MRNINEDQQKDDQLEKAFNVSRKAITKEQKRQVIKLVQRAIDYDIDDLEGLEEYCYKEGIDFKSEDVQGLCKYVWKHY